MPAQGKRSAALGSMAPPNHALKEQNNGHPVVLLFQS